MLMKFSSYLLHALNLKMICSGFQLLDKQSRLLRNHFGVSKQVLWLEAREDALPKVLPLVSLRHTIVSELLGIGILNERGNTNI